MELSDADVRYVRANYVTLEELAAARGETPDAVRALVESGRLPRPSYVLPDGTEMVPRDYFAFLDEAGSVEAIRPLFERRFVAAGGAPGSVDEEWQHYLSGVYGVCLRDVTPENIVRKESLVTEIDGLLADAKPGDQSWRARLRAAVDELDALEREFSPDYDRSLGTPPSRDRCVKAARERFPDVFAAAAVG